MIEILILYIIHKREKTIYSIRKEISELFGYFTKPSIGTIYPALKRLLSQKAVSLVERMSDGGKKSSYYGITKKGLDLFREYYFSTLRDNPSLFYTRVQARLATMGLLNIEERKRYISELNKEIDGYQYEIENLLKNEYINADYFQTQSFIRTVAEYKALKEYLKKLKVD